LGMSSAGRFFLLSLRPGTKRDLDVSLLHALLLERLLGIDRTALQKQTNVRYVKDFTDALRQSRDPTVQAAFLLNPTRLDDLRTAVDAGNVLPQKTTYFYPKLASGLVIAPIDAAEAMPT